MFIFCFALDCMLVQIWVQSKSCLPQDLFEVYFFVFFLLTNHIVIFFCLW